MKTDASTLVLPNSSEPTPVRPASVPGTTSPPPLELDLLQVEWKKAEESLPRRPVEEPTLRQVRFGRD